MHSFANLAYDAKTLAELIGLTEKERFISYLPLAHIVERAGLEGTALLPGMPRLLHARASTPSWPT